MPEAQLISHTPVVKVDGTELAAESYDDVVDVRVELSVHVPDRFTIRFRDPEFDLFDGGTFAIGKAVEIGFALPSEAPVTVLTKAEVTSVTIEQNADDRPILVVSGYDKGHRLARQTVVKTYVKQKDSDIASAIAGRHGLTPQVEATTVTHDYLAQNETDYAFLTERARVNGYNWWVADGKLFFKKQPEAAGGPTTLKLGEDLRKFKVRISADLADDYAVNGWDDKAKQAISGTEKVATSLEFVGTDAKLIKDISGKKAFAAAKRSIGHLPVRDQSEAKAVARSLALRIAGEQVIARGEAVHHPELRAGGKVKIEQAGDKASGTYVLTSVEHVWGGGQALSTRFVSGGKEAAGLVDLLGGTAQTSRGGGAGWGRLGVVIGLVTNTQDPDNLGRVKVKLPTMGKDDEGVEVESTWARVLTMGGGKQRGMWWMPEIDDEVLVAFEHGDLRRPVVLGGLWNSQDKPPGTTSEMFKNGKVVAYRLQSESGHVLLIGQRNDEEMIELLHADGKTAFTLGKDGVLLNAESMDITVTGRKKITLEAEGDFALKAANIKLEAQQKVEVKAGTDFKAEGGTNVTLKASANLKAEGGAMTEIKGSMLKAEASGIAQLKGSMVKIN